MKILCISDQIDPLVYSDAIRQRFGDVDLVLSAGDLPMDYLEFVVTSLNKPLFFVFGNHNLKELNYYTGKEIRSGWEDVSEHSSGAVHIGSKIRMENGLIVAGLGGSMEYNHGENQYTEFRMKMEMLKLLPGLIFNRIFRGRYLDILLTHASPRGIHDREDKCHWGFKCFLAFMRFFRPKYLVHGHIHLYSLSDLRISSYCDTQVINAYSHHVIDTGKGI
ncbi:MAG: metallophosphoesterase [Treponema sp.]|jgi:Icc-related predicted phosphoesterase|nr:metallophosphoesterase [Treponema sp.]